MAAIILPIGVGWKFTRAANNIQIYGVPANGMGISGSAGYLPIRRKILPRMSCMQSHRPHIARWLRMFAGECFTPVQSF